MNYIMNHERRPLCSLTSSMVESYPLQLCLSQADPGPVSTLERTVDITQHVEIVTSASDQIEQYISEAEAEAQPSFFAPNSLTTSHLIV